MTTTQISDTLMDIYGFEVSESFISDIIDKILPQIEKNAINGMTELHAGEGLPGRLPGCYPLFCPGRRDNL